MSSPTPETDAEASITHLDCDDSCVEIYIKRGGKDAYGDVVLADFSRKLERQRDEARKEAAMWKANHDNQAKLKAALLDRHDLGERARKVLSLAKERDEALERLRFALKGAQQGSEEARKAIRQIQRKLDEARELAVDLQSALITTLASLIIRMGPEDVDTVENAHQVLGKAKQLLKP